MLILILYTESRSSVIWLNLKNNLIGTLNIADPCKCKHSEVMYSVKEYRQFSAKRNITTHIWWIKYHSMYRKSGHKVSIPVVENINDNRIYLHVYMANNL